MRSSRDVKLTTAGRVLLDEAPLALAALERAAECTRLAGAGITGNVRLGYPPPASFETLGAILAAVEDDNPNMTVIASELFSAGIPGRVLICRVVCQVGVFDRVRVAGGFGVVGRAGRRARCRRCQSDDAGVGYPRARFRAASVRCLGTSVALLSGCCS